MPGQQPQAITHPSVRPDGPSAGCLQHDHFLRCMQAICEQRFLVSYGSLSKTKRMEPSDGVETVAVAEEETMIFVRFVFIWAEGAWIRSMSSTGSFETVDKGQVSATGSLSRNISRISWIRLLVHEKQDEMYPPFDSRMPWTLLLNGLCITA